MKRLEIGIDGNCIYVGLGFLPEPDSKFVFVEIDNRKEAPPMQGQRNAAYEQWCEKFPEEGRLPYEVIR